MLVINLAAIKHGPIIYYSARPTVTSQLQSVTVLGSYQFLLLGEQRYMNVN